MAKKNDKAEEVDDAKEEVDFGEEKKDGEDVANLADQLQARLHMKDYYRRHHIDGLLVTVWNWSQEEVASGDQEVYYISICVAVLGCVEDDDVFAKVVGPKTVRVYIDYPEGGEDTMAEHLLIQHADNPDFTITHPKYVALSRGARAYKEVVSDRRSKIEIPLPFEINKSGFIDPLEDDPNYHVGVFPLPEHKQIPGAPQRSISLLELTVQERDKPKIKQKATAKTYFSPAWAAVGSGMNIR